MNLGFQDNKSLGVSFEYQREENLFVVYDNENTEVCCVIPELKLDDEYTYKEYRIVCLHNDRSDYSENCIYQAYVGDLRIGWIFPIGALFSNEHSFADNAYFLKYAYVAYCLLIESLDKQDYRYEDEYSLKELYDDDLTVLVLCSENTANIDGFCIEDYVVSLFKYGYSFEGHGNLLSQIANPAGQRMKLKPISSFLMGSSYIQTLFGSELSNCNTDTICGRGNGVPEGISKGSVITTFHFLYQVIEMLISKVFDCEMEKIVSRLQEENRDMFSVRESISEVINEKKRVSLLFEKYINGKMTSESWKQNERSLSEKCGNLIKLGIEEGEVIECDKDETVALRLYRVRCLVTHNMHSFSNRAYPLLQDINSTFLDVVLELLICFVCPSVGDQLT